MTRIRAFARSIERAGWVRHRDLADTLGRTRDFFEAPLLLDALLVVGFFFARVFEKPAALTAVVVIGSIVALRWPATGAALASLAFLFPVHPGGLESGAPLLMSAGIGCLVASVRSDARLGVDPAIVFATALVATTGLALLRLLGGPLAGVGAEATIRWAGLTLGLASLPIQLFLIRRGARRALAILAGATAAAVGIGFIDGLWPGALESTALRSLLSIVPSDRATGPFPSPNRLGTVAAVAAVVAGALVWERRGWWRFALGLGAIAATVAVFASFSRGALLGLLIGAVALVARRSPRLAVAAAVIGAGAVFALTPIFMDARLETAGAPPGLSAEQAANDAGRVEAWLAGLRMGAAQPVTGQGYGAFAVLGSGYGGPANLFTAHNEMIALFAEVGLPGAVSFGGLIAACLWSFRRRSVAHDLGLAAVLVFVTASSFNVQSVYPQVTTPIWALVAWGLALGKVSSISEGAGRNELGGSKQGDAHAGPLDRD
jgi:O-antigen ligase